MSDTTPDAARFYHERLRALPAAERLRIAASLSASVRRLAEAGIRLRFPDIGERELAARLAARLYGDKVAARFFPDVPLDATAR